MKLASQLGGLEGLLAERGMLTPAQVGDYGARAEAAGVTLAAYLGQQGLLAEETLLRLQGELHGLPFVKLRETPVASEAVRMLAPKFAAHYQIMPIRFKDGVLTIAVSHPTAREAVEDIETNLGCGVERVLASARDIQEALHIHYGVGADTVERLLAEERGAEEAQPAEESHDLETLAADASVVNLVNQLLREAIAHRATDIHFEVYRDGIVARRRIDGILTDTHLPGNIRRLYPAIVSRVKLMSGLNIVERRMPQDGRARVKIGSSDYDLRVSIVPAIHGEDVVIRILPSTMIFDLGGLGFSEAQVAALRTYIAIPHGILFVTGPTGSGKSTTLYACLSTLNTRDRKIITIEDPVEYELRGVTQTAVNPKIGLTFAHALRAMLRHDPDVMLVGEVRDRETAEIATQTAMTGHLVLSSLHTNDAAGAAVRLIDMGIDPYLIASTVLVFVAQRLVRVICPQCRESYVEEGRTLFRGAGCGACNQSGYHGRMAICEMLPLEREIRELILARAPAKDIRAAADRLGMRTMTQDGWDKVALGMTTAEEVLRVTRL